jgi:geranylgeranyl reductase family protein
VENTHAGEPIPLATEQAITYHFLLSSDGQKIKGYLLFEHLVQAGWGWRFMKVDVAIIGAGPSGGMAACQLAQTGLTVMILEKEELPRHKSCGGALPGSIGDFLKWDLGPVIENRTSDRKWLCNYAQPSVIRCSPMVMVDRSRFDASLIQRALSMGQGNIELRDGFRVSHVDVAENGIIIRGNAGEVVRAEFLIAADGALSKTARSLGLKRDAPCGMAIDAEVEVVPETYQDERSVATFNYFCIDKGYGWIFPKREGSLSCGLVSWSRQQLLLDDMKEFLVRSLPEGCILSVKMYKHPIPFYSGHRQIATRRVCLVGDAASLVDPITGGGMYYSLQSGVLAADVISAALRYRPSIDIYHEALTREVTDCRLYQHLIHQGIGRYLEELRRFIQPIFLDKPEFFYRKFIQKGENYSHLARHLSGYREGGVDGEKL